MDKPFTILPDAPAMPGAKASPFYVQKEKKGEQKSYRTITHWHDELECLTILDGTLDFQLNESVISLQKGSTLIVLPGAIHRNLTKPEDTVFMRILANPALLTANEEIREKLVRSLLQYTDTSVADIAFNCGFTSQSYFTKLFSRTFHMTPTEFRNSTKKISI